MSVSRPTHVRWLICCLACFASWLLYLHRYAWGVVKPEFRKEYPSFDSVAVGWLDSAFLATYAFGQIPSGLLADRFGPRLVLSILALVWSPASVGVAWTSGFWRLIGARAVFGLAQAGVYPVLNKMTRTWFPLASRTTVQGLVTALGRIGGACAPVVVAYLLILSFSWQTALLIISIPGLVLAAAFWLFVRDTPREHPWVSEAEASLIEGNPASSTSAASNPAPAPTERPALLLTGASLFSLAMLFLYIFASTFQDQFYVYWLTTFLKEAKGFDDAMVAEWGPWPLLAGALGGIIGGFLNDLFIRLSGNQRWSRSTIAFTGKFLAAVTVAFSVQVGDGRLVVMVLSGARVFSDWSLPTQWAAVTDMGGRAVATLFALVNTVGIIGGFFANPLFGYLLEAYGWPGVQYGVAAMCLIAATTWLFIDCTKRLVSD